MERNERSGAQSPDSRTLKQPLRYRTPFHPLLLNVKNHPRERARDQIELSHLVHCKAHTQPGHRSRKKLPQHSGRGSRPLNAQGRRGHLMEPGGREIRREETKDSCACTGYRAASISVNAALGKMPMLQVTPDRHRCDSRKLRLTPNQNSGTPRVSAPPPLQPPIR